MFFISWADPLVRTFILIEDKAILLLMTRYIATIVMEVRFVSPIAASATMASFALTATVVVIIIAI